MDKMYVYRVSYILDTRVSIEKHVYAIVSPCGSSWR